MKNVLQVLNYAANYRGNFMDSLKELDNQLHKKGHYCVYLFMVSKDYAMTIDWISEMIKENIPVYFIPDSKIEQINQLHKIINKHNIGTVHTHFLSAKQFLITKICTVGLQIDIIVHFHNHAVPSKYPVKCFIRKLMYTGCKMVGVSASVAEGLRRIFPYCRCYEINNAIDFKRLEKYCESDYICQEWDSNIKKCLIFGFDYMRKGVDLALEAVSQIVEAGDKIVLLISLSTNEEIVKKQIENKFGKIPSWVKCIKARNDVATLYRNVDVFLSPSREEGFCYSIVEAAYCSCNVVASRIPAQEDLEVPGVFWFETENIDELRQAIVVALKKTEKVCKQEKLKERYNLNSWAQKVIAVYEEI